MRRIRKTKKMSKTAKATLMLIGSVIVIGTPIATMVAIYSNKPDPKIAAANAEIDAAVGKKTMPTLADGASTETAALLDTSDFIAPPKKGTITFSIINVTKSLLTLDGSVARVTIEVRSSYKGTKVGHYDVEVSGFKTIIEAWKDYLHNTENHFDQSFIDDSIHKVDKIGKIVPRAFLSKDIPDTFTIPEFITAIGDSAFQGATLPDDFTIPESVTTIGKNAFAAAHIESSKFKIPLTVTLIDESAFAYAFLHTDFIIPQSSNSLTIAPNAFDQVTML